MSEVTRNDLAQAIRLLRTLRGMTYDDLATRSELSRDHIRQIERGEREVAAGALEHIARGLGCTCKDLLPNEGGTAVERIIGREYSRAHKLVQRATVFLLTTWPITRTKMALLNLIVEQIPMHAPENFARMQTRAALAPPPEG